MTNEEAKQVLLRVIRCDGSKCFDENCRKCQYNYEYDDKFTALEIAVEALSLPVEEVRHGCWIDERNIQEYHCSECGAEAPNDGYDCGAKYCYNCGAKMDGTQAVFTFRMVGDEVMSASFNGKPVSLSKMVEECFRRIIKGYEETEKNGFFGAKMDGESDE